MSSSLFRFFRLHRPDLARRIANELSPDLGPEPAREEAEALLSRMARPLERMEPEPLIEAVHQAAAGWAARGAEPSAVARALLTFVIPRAVLRRRPRAQDPWPEVLDALESVLDSVPLPILVLDLDHRVRHSNRALDDYLDVRRGEVHGAALADLLTPECREWARRQLGPRAAASPNSPFGRLRLRPRPEAEALVSGVPLVAGPGPIGWYLALFPDPGRSLDDPSMGGLLRDEKSQKGKFAALLTVSHAVANTLDLNTILTTIAQQVRQVIQTDECTVFLYDEQAQLLCPVVCDVESYREEMMAVRLRLGEGITGSVALSGHGEIVNSAESDPRSVQVPGTPPEQSALLCVPLLTRERVVGVITLVRTGGLGFVEEDLELATLFAGQCSAAIANARLFEETKRAYDELREAQSQLVQSAKLNALGEMAGGVAHDFNNILAAILGRTQLVLQEVQDPGLRRQLEVVEQAALDGAHVVRRVQEFTRVRQDERFESVDLNEVVMGVIELTRPAWEAGAKRRGTTIELEVDLQATRPIAGNASELREVVTNLLLNAVDAMPWGGILTVATADGDGEVLMRVRDTGVGMDEETRDRIFDPFFTTKSIKGTGLGLSVAYGIVTRHHGSITVDSEQHVGTEFRLRFPEGQAESVRPSPDPDGPLPRLRVLVVDDEESVLDVMADLLRSLGQEVETALGGPAGVQALARGRYDVVFSDLGMPEVNGWDLAITVKSRHPETAVVLVTGWGFQLEGGTAQSRGVELVLPKPFSIEEIEGALRQVADQRRPGDERPAA